MLRLLDCPDKCRKFLAKAKEIGLKNIKQLDDDCKSDEFLFVTADDIPNKEPLAKLVRELFGDGMKLSVRDSNHFTKHKYNVTENWNCFPDGIHYHTLHECNRYYSTYLLETQFENLGGLTPKWHLKNKIYKPITELIYKFVNVDVGNIIWDYIGFTPLFEFVGHQSTTKIQRCFYNTDYQIVKCEDYNKIKKEVKYSLTEFADTSWNFTLKCVSEYINEKTTIVGGYYLICYNYCVVTHRMCELFSYLY